MKASKKIQAKLATRQDKYNGKSAGTKKPGSEKKKGKA